MQSLILLIATVLGGCWLAVTALSVVGGVPIRLAFRWVATALTVVVSIFIVTYLLCGCSVCEGALFYTDQGICVMENARDRSREEIQEYIDVTEQAYIDYTEYSRENIEQVYADHEISLYLTDTEIDHDHGRDVYGLCTTNLVGNWSKLQIEDTLLGDLFGSLNRTALTHELMHAYLHAQRIFGHPARHFIQAAPSTGEAGLATTEFRIYYRHFQLEVRE